MERTKKRQLATALYPVRTMNDSYVTELAPTGEGWQLKVKTPGGLSLEYSYASEQQARYFAAVFHLGPSRLPAADRIIPPTRRRSRAVKRVHELDNVSTDEIEGALGALGELAAANDDKHDPSVAEFNASLEASFESLEATADPFESFESLG